MQNILAINGLKQIATLTLLCTRSSSKVFCFNFSVKNLIILYFVSDSELATQAPKYEHHFTNVYELLD